MSSAQFVGEGFNPPLVPLNPQVCIDPPEKIVKIRQKYIADLLWFSHKSSTEDYVCILLK